MPFAVHWNPPWAKQKIANIALFAKTAFFQFLNNCYYFILTLIDFTKTPLERG